MANASLEIHVINISQGDAILVVNRDVPKLQAKVSAVTGAPTEPMDFLPFAVEQKLDLHGTVTKALLIDGGDGDYGGFVEDYLRQVGVAPAASDYVPELSLMISHHHADHAAGLRSVYKKAVPVPPPPPKPTKKKGKKKAVPPPVKMVDHYRPAAVYRPKDDSRKPSDRELYYKVLLKDLDAAAAATVTPTQIHVLDKGGVTGAAPTKIDLGKGGTGPKALPITVHVIGSAQGVWDAVTSKVVDIDNPAGLDQNDRSMIVMIEYGSFRFFAAGDIAGNGQAAGGNTGANAASTAGKKWFSSSHADVESRLGPALEAYFPRTVTPAAGSPQQKSAGCCTVLKVSHHGSNSSTDVYSLATLRPEIALISSGLRPKFHGHPTQAVLNRLAQSQTADWGIRGQPATVTTPNTVSGVYITEIAEQVNSTAFTVDIREAVIVGDIVVRPTDESVRAVQDEAAFDQAALDVRVYGTRVATAATKATTTVRAASAGTSALTYYPYGPDEFTVDRH
ncbi:ComEC/Rec2 family competence protein [Streptomyces polygonati]|uniref:ComEC/Rec2 family competence protein n=1 Tax=Streptomyces polygonati TaxID=1617087 RepID=A0ABV8HMT8_9ACTN